MDIVAVQIINGLSYGMILFLVTVGLSLILGIMGVLNLANGSFYMLGAYVAFSLVVRSGYPFLLALLIAPLVIAGLSLLLEMGLLRPTYRLGHLSQVLLTFGLAYLIHDVIRLIWGSNVQSLPLPSALNRPFEIFGQTMPSYRLYVLLGGLVIVLAMELLQSKTRWGAIIRAGLTNPEMVESLGINIKRVHTVVFAIGGFLAGLGGVVVAPVFGLAPGMEFEILILSLVVLVIGGLGTLSGPLVASLVVGLIDTFGKVLFPELSLVFVFALMAVVLILKPTGLFGKQVVE